MYVVHYLLRSLLWSVAIFLALPHFVYAHNVETMLTLLIDSTMWLFVLVNAAIISIIVWALLKVFGTSYQPSESAKKEIGKGVIIFFLLVLVYQIFHHLEHIVQVYQYAILGLPALESAGILWFFNIEWNHFVFNSGYFIGLVVALVIIGRALRRHGELVHFSNLFLIGGLFLVQGWHTLEHSVRIVRHITIGCEPCSGILDALFGWGLIYLHFIFNTIVLILPLALFFWLGFHRRLALYKSLSEK